MSNSPLHELPGSSSLNGLIQGNGSGQATSLLLNLSAIVDPTVTDDSLEGYSVGSIWVNTNSNTFFICTNNTASNASWSSGGGNGMAGMVFSVTASNSFAIGKVIRFDGSNYQLAQADNVTDSEVVGVVQTASGSQFTYVSSGFLMWSSHGFTPGKVLFLSPTTPGGMIESDVSTVGQISKPVAIVLDADNLAILNYRGFAVGADNTAKNDKTYLTFGAEGATLSNSRQLAVSVPLKKTDGGAGSTLTLGLDITLLTAGSTFGDTDVWMQYNANDTALRKTTTDVLRSIMNGSARVDVASATTTNLASTTSDYINITGTTTITAFGTPRTGARKNILFAGSLLLTYNASSMILPGGASITTAAGDTAIAVHEGSGNWRVLNYELASGKSIISQSTPANQTIYNTSGAHVFTPVTAAVYFLILGAGGGGASGGKGGGAGGWAIGLLRNLTPGTPFTVTLGTGGTGSVSGQAAGTGGSSTLASYCTVTGGTGAGSSNGTQGAPGSWTSYDINNVVPLFHRGLIGSIGTLIASTLGGNGSTSQGGGGGHSYFGTGGAAGGDGSVALGAGTLGGGGGGSTGATVNHAGFGSPGYCILWW